MRRIIYIFAWMMMCSSCAVYTNYIPQQTAYTTMSDTTALLTWQQFYKNEQLQDLIQKALTNNSNLQIAKLLIIEAAASLRGARGLLWPSITVSGESSVSSFDRAKADVAYSIGPTISWEADIFRKQSNAVQANLASVEGHIANAQFVQTELIAATAQSYYTLEMLDAKKQLTLQAITSWDEQIRVLKALKEAGEATQSDISQAEASRYETETMMQQIERQITVTTNSILSLIGSQEADVICGQFSTTDFSEDMISNIPLSALATRPDIREAEATLKASFYQTNLARSAFYPSIRLSGTVGWTNNGGAGISNPGAMLLQAVASLIQPILANGQNHANLAIAKSQQERALVVFQQKVLDAGLEVNNAQKAYQTSEKMATLQLLQIEKLQETLRAATTQMQLGDGNALQILVARQALLAAQMERLNCEYEQINSYITLFRALGGGYSYQSN